MELDSSFGPYPGVTSDALSLACKLTKSSVNIPRVNSHTYSRADLYHLHSNLSAVGLPARLGADSEAAIRVF